MMKYFFIFLAILSFVLKELFVTSKKKPSNSEDEEKSGIKKLTPVGWFLFGLSAMILLGSIYNDEKNAIDEKDKINQKVILDSIRYNTTILNQENIIDLNKKMQISTEDMNLFLRGEVSRLKKQLNKQEKISLKGQYPIPEYFWVSFDLVFDIEENNLQEYESRIKSEQKEHVERKLDEGDTSFMGIDKKLLPTRELASNLYGLNWQPIIDINFKNKKDERIIGLYDQTTMKYRNESPELGINFKDTYYFLWYNPVKRQIKFQANQLKIPTYQNPKYSSMKDILGTVLEFRFSNWSSIGAHKFEVESMAIRTPKRQIMFLKEFKKNSKNGTFTRKIDERNMWK